MGECRVRIVQVLQRDSHWNWTAHLLHVPDGEGARHHVALLVPVVRHAGCEAAPGPARDHAQRVLFQRVGRSEGVDDLVEHPVARHHHNAGDAVQHTALEAHFVRVAAVFRHHHLALDPRLFQHRNHGVAGVGFGVALAADRIYEHQVAFASRLWGWIRRCFRNVSRQLPDGPDEVLDLSQVLDGGQHEGAVGRHTGRRAMCARIVGRNAVVLTIEHRPVRDARRGLGLHPELLEERQPVRDLGVAVHVQRRVALRVHQDFRRRSRSCGRRHQLEHFFVLASVGIAGCCCCHRCFRRIGRHGELDGRANDIVDAHYVQHRPTFVARYDLEPSSVAFSIT
jgi:hypothetical protein